MPSFETPHPITATLEIPAGSVRLVASDRTDTVVDVRPRDESRREDVEAAKRVRVDFDNGALAVRSERGFRLPRRGAVVVDVGLPTGSRLHASVASADLTADGEYADCRLSSASGDLTVHRVRGNLKADTASGDVAVELAAEATVSTASGDATVGEVCGQARMRTASGSLHIGRLEGDLMAQTASGGVAVATAVRGSISVQTSSGPVGLGIANGTAAQLDLHTRSGTVRNELQSTDGPAAGDDTLTVRARTASGDVVVQRAV